MLTTLSIRDFVLIDQLNLELGMGLTTLTGETGAGKSILLDALGVCIGLRASPDMVRRGARQASITAVFDVPDRHPVFHELRELGLQIDDSELVLRRVIQADGRSRAFVNDEPTSAGTLRRLGETMVEIQGQFDLHGLLSPAHHRSVLDAFAGHGNLLSAVQRSHEALQAAEAELERAREDLAQAQREESYLRHATEELEELAPEVGEVARLEARRGLLANMAGVQEAVEQAAHALYGGGAGSGGGGNADGEGGDTSGEGADARLNQAYRALERASERGGGEALQPALAAVDRAAVEVNEALAQLQAVEQALEADPAALAQVEDRLFRYRELARKHSGTPDDLAPLLDRFRRGLEALDDSSAHMEALEAALAQARAQYDEAAQRLSASRHEAALRLDQTVMGELPVLKLEHARFRTEIVTDAEGRSALGVDAVTFTAATNAGAAFTGIQKTASGGELSRFLLALKVALANDNPLPTLVFDEVDAGVGGATAEAVGRRLQKLARRVQVLVITHSPQVAAKGAHHLRVSKSDTAARDGGAGGMSDSSPNMTTDVRPLSADERRLEIARMVAGDSLTPEAEAAAQALLRDSQR
ncbi:MAG: DNA repair protein RecN [Rhodospirillaceae bacterium]|nr:DNA repair protein RecN [Rhodospirillaceae bacterium]